MHIVPGGDIMLNIMPFGVPSARIHGGKKLGCHKENENFSFTERSCIHDSDRNGTEIICEQKNNTKRTRKKI